MLNHGGRLKRAAQQFSIDATSWLDLSTGINPNGWLIPSLPTDCWQRLPEPEDGLLEAANTFYGCSTLLPTAGSQAAIQTLPYLRPQCRVGVPSIGYEEHRYHWHQAGHQLISLQTAQIDNQLDQLEVLVLINPNNPTGERFASSQLLQWHDRLARRGGWLIVDEAFIDARPEDSLLRHCPRPGLIVLRSIGKFFGLAGIRAGFAFTDTTLLQPLAEKLGPWPLSGPTREVCRLALLDRVWQQQTREQLIQRGQRLQQLLQQHFDNEKVHGTELFQTLNSPCASRLYQHFAEQGVLLRHFENEQLLRFGLPSSPTDWHRLEQLLAQLPEELSTSAPTRTQDQPGASLTS